MKEGEPILGGPQANPGFASTPNPGTQPAIPATPQNNTSTPNPFNAPTTKTPSISSQSQFQSFSSPVSSRPHFASRPQPVSTTPGDIILSNSTPKSSIKSKKPLIIIAVIAAVLLIGLLIYFIIFQTQNASTKNNAATEFSDSYIELLDSYSDIGYDPPFDALPFIYDMTLFPYSQEYLQELNDKLSLAKEKLITFQTQDPENTDLQNDAQNTINIIEQNLTILKDFNEAFYMPIEELLNAEEDSEYSATPHCVISEDMNKLINSSNEQIKEAAEAYQTNYCNINESVFSNQSTVSLSIELIISAKTKLMDTLQTINSEETGYDKAYEISLRGVENEE